MYESEVNRRTESSEQIGAEDLARFHELANTLLERTVLPWSEHCTECVWPTCYTTCDLYSAREDGRCRRFVDGMVRIDDPQAASQYLLKIRFKRWGKLWTPGSVALRSMEDALRLEHRDQRIGSVLYQIPVFPAVRSLAIQKRYSFKKRQVHKSTGLESLPTAFIVECFNPAAHTIRLSLTMRSADPNIRVPFQYLAELGHGYHRIRIPFEQIAKVLDMRSGFNIELVPNEDETETLLYFGLMEFVKEAVVRNQTTEDRAEKGSKKIKCVVWDLDNTMWDGILVEDGPDKLNLKPGIRELLVTLDERGILHSVASKNNREEALAVLKKFGIEEYFLAPQISWKPKSEGIAAIARDLNIGIDSLMFVDDSEFELQQVKSVHPDVRLLPAAAYLELAAMKELQVPVTQESRERRKMYQVESQRQNIAEDFGSDYSAFLRHCNIKISLKPMTAANLTRVHELTQRTNQMNFSGNRYERSALETILSTPYLDTYVLEVEDRYGSYGIVGFCVVDSRVPLMTDLMFSCRVQAKRVEHAFLAHIIRKYIAATGKDFQANYRKTPRNAPSGQVFADLLLQEVKVEDGLSRLIFPRNQAVPDDQIIQIAAEEGAVAVHS